MSMWKCPACSTPLLLNNKTWACENGHCYDVAKEGYVNLLLVQHKNSKEPGDNKQMVNGRRAFLEQGFYQPLSDAISDIFNRYLSTLGDDTNLSFFDAGCGEGYYLAQVKNAISQTQWQVEFSGVDISKFAVQKAAKKYSQQHFAVASTYQLPLQSSTQNAVLQIFAPSSEQEIHRVLKDHGIWITVNPAANHLFEMKQALYDSPNEHTTQLKVPAGFVLQQQLNVNFELPLTEPQHCENLLMMTPYYWSATAEKKQQLIANLTTITADFDICVFCKQSV